MPASLPQPPRSRRSINSHNQSYEVLLSCALVLGLALVFGWYMYAKEQNEFEQVKLWLKKNDLLHFSELFFKHGYLSLSKVSTLSKLKTANILKKSILKESPQQILTTIDSIMAAKDAMIENERYSTWLIENGIEHLRDDLGGMGIGSLQEAVDKLELVKTSAFMVAYHAIIDLEIHKGSLHRYPIFYSSFTLKNIVSTVLSWLKFTLKLLAFLCVTISLVGVFLIKTIVADFQRALPSYTNNSSSTHRRFWDAFRNVFSSNRNRAARGGGGGEGAPPLSSDRRYGFFDSLLGRTFSPQASVIAWNTNNFVVGNELVMTVQFFARNRNPFKVSDLVGVKCEVLCSRSLVETAVVHSQENDNQISIHFTPTVADVQYLISVMADGQHVGESPYKITFVPAGLDPIKSSLVVPSSLLVLEEGIQEQLNFDERDKYGNVVVSGVEDLLKYEFLFHEFKEDGQRIFPFLTFNSQKNLYSKYATSAGLTVIEAGVYTVDVLYNDEPFSTGVVLLVLTESQMCEVTKNITNTPYSLYYEAQMFTSYKAERTRSIASMEGLVSTHNIERTVTTMEPADTAKRKKVYVYISPKFLTIKEFYMKIFAKRSYVYRIKPSVKISLHSGENSDDGECFTIQSSSTSQPTTLYCRHRNVVVATFVKLLLKNIGGSENFQDKKRYFQKELHQLAANKTYSKLEIKVNRETLLKDSMRVLKFFNKYDWWKHFYIKFEGELGMDCGGVSREWFHLVLEKLFSTETGGLFRRFNKEDTQALIHPNPHRKEEFQKLRFYEFAGQMMGKCLIECSCSQQRQQYVKARFTRSFLAQLLGVEITWKFFETDDKALYNGKVKHILENDPSDLEIFFVEECYDGDDNLIKTVELKANGSNIHVTEANKMEYLQRMAEYRLQESVKHEIASFHKGLTSIVEDGLLSIFDENELELLVCGMDVISVADMKTNCEATDPNSEQMNQFWSILSGFSQEELSRLLQFTTGCSQLPPEGFKGLMPRLQIRSSYQQNYLPVSHTCMNLLILPLSNSSEELRRKIILAITEGCEGFGLA